MLSCLPAIALPKCFGPNQERLQNFGRIKQKFTTSCAVFDDIFKLTLNLFSCLSSTRPTLVINCFVIVLDSKPSRPNQNLPKLMEVDQILQFRPNSQFWPNFTISVKFHNFDQILQFWPFFTISAKHHNFNQLSQLRTNFTISTKFHNFNQISQF